MGRISEVWRSWHDARRFLKLPEQRRRIVFYSEGRSYWKYLGDVIRALINIEGTTLAYLTSDVNDPLLNNPPPQIDAFYIGGGSVRTLLFRNLRAGVLVTTMPDLGNFYIKRSSVYPVHYVYLHHSIVSTHMIYRSGAFDNFDSILCVGPHHIAETRAWEAFKGLRAKRLFEHGYAPLDELRGLSTNAVSQQPRAGRALKVLLAPSWGPDCILERGSEPLIDALLQAGHRVIVRPHPMTQHISGAKLDALTQRYRDDRRFSFDGATASLQALIDADVMISDWSGVAMEFAFGLERPVLFLDVPRKVNNSQWDAIGIAPLEDAYRSEVGCILDHQRPFDAPTAIAQILESSSMLAMRAKNLRAKYVFNLGASGQRGAVIVSEIARESLPYRGLS